MPAMALDLTTSVPRSPFDELDGFPWLPRMNDKARAHFAGTLGEYSPYPCPGDQNFLRHFGIDAAALGEVIKGGADDAAIAAWVQAHAAKADDATKAAFRAKLRGPERNPVLRLALWFFTRKNLAAIEKNSPHVRRDQIVGFSHMVAAEEGHALPS